ncbi:MAG: rubrerythrin family protein [Bacteroidales bacterium]
MNELIGSESATLITTVYQFKNQVILQYEFFAKQAKKDGFEQISALFLETAEQMRSHSKTLFRILEGTNEDSQSALSVPPISNTLENLRIAVATENRFIELLNQAENMSWAEGFKKASTKLKLFRQISEFYSSRFTKLASNIENGTVFKKDHKVKWICRKCGLIYENDRALHNCPGCEHPQSYFEVLAENW